MIGINHIEILSGSATIVKVEGPLNGQTCFDFEDYINQLINKHIFYILFDTKDIDYISSEGIGVLLLVQQKISELNGYLVFFNLSEELESFFAILGFDKVFKIADSRIHAIQIMDRQIELREMGKECFDDQKVIYNMNIEQLESTNSLNDKGEDNKIIETYLSNKSKLTIKQLDKNEDNNLVIEDEPVDIKKEINQNADNIVLGDVVENDKNFQNDNENLLVEKFSETERIEKEKNYEINTSNRLFQQPLIIECKKCKSLVRIKAPGEYLCPDCRTVFTAHNNQIVFFDTSL